MFIAALSNSPGLILPFYWTLKIVLASIDHPASEDGIYYTVLVSDEDHWKVRKNLYSHTHACTHTQGQERMAEDVHIT